MNKHTPGPWKVASVFVENAPNQIHVTTGKWGAPSIAVVDNADNAQLIAAAPELLEALENVLPALDRAFAYDGDVFGILHNDAVDAYSKARATIDKARREA